MAFLRAENRFLCRAPLSPNEGRKEGTRARHIPVSDLPGELWRLSDSRTKTPPGKAKKAFYPGALLAQKGGKRQQE